MNLSFSGAVTTHASSKQWATSQRGWGPPSSLQMARVAEPGRPSPPTATPRCRFPSPPGTYQLSTGPSQKGAVLGAGPCGIRKGHEDRAELFLLEVSRAGTKPNLQSPLKCHPPLPSPPPPGQSASHVRATRQRQGLRFASAKSQTKPPAYRPVPPPCPLLGGCELSLALPETR